MNFFKKLFTPRPSNPGKFHIFAVKCKRCGEIIHGQVNVNNDPAWNLTKMANPITPAARCWWGINCVSSRSK